MSIILTNKNTVRLYNIDAVSIRLSQDQYRISQPSVESLRYPEDHNL